MSPPGLARMSKADAVTKSPSRHVPTAAPRGLATCGWVVEAVMAESSQILCVGTEHAADAEAFVLLHPGILPSDQRIARRHLSSAELCDLNLKTGAVRP